LNECKLIIKKQISFGGPVYIIVLIVNKIVLLKLILSVSHIMFLAHTHMHTSTSRIVPIPIL
jgi:hypothetical protein